MLFVLVMHGNESLGRSTASLCSSKFGSRNLLLNCMAFETQIWNSVLRCALQLELSEGVTLGLVWYGGMEWNKIECSQSCEFLLLN